LHAVGILWARAFFWLMAGPRFKSALTGRLEKFWPFSRDSNWWRIQFNPDSAVERKSWARSKPSIAKTMHSASEHGNNRECCLSLRWPINQHPRAKKTLKLHDWVSSLFQVCCSLILNCGIRV